LANGPLITEQRNQASAGLDEMSVESILYLMNQEDRRVPEAVAEVLPQIAEAVGLMVEAWRSGGVGSTSAQGRAAASRPWTRPNANLPSGCHRTG
jgi:N-acetylmuramic acid 6-phosphate (MurNAc-6-P) etherase